MAADSTAASAALGIWGGDRLQLTVDATGARVALDCANGSISMPLVLDAHGSFAANGKFETYEPGPQKADSGGAATVRYSGVVKGDLMTLTIHTGTTPQIFKLRKGVAIKQVRCL